MRKKTFQGQQFRPRISKQEYEHILSRRNEKVKENRVLVIFDLHAPFIKYGYLDFCKSIYQKYNCNQVVFIGDIIDNHFTSFHDIDPDGHGAGRELQLAKEQIMEFYEVFPKAKVCIGNHEIIVNRKAFNSGISSNWIKSIDEVLDVKGWDFSEEHIIDDVLYTHGTGRKARQRCMNEFISVVQGHYHSETYYETYYNGEKMNFALQGGCGVDRKSYAMAYGRNFKKPQINVAVVMDNGRWALIEHIK